MSTIPLAHMGHAIAFLPFFAPPIVLTLGILLLIARDRLTRSHRSNSN